MIREIAERTPRNWPSIAKTPAQRATWALSRLEDITRLVSEWVWETDTKGNLVFVSDRVTEILGVLPAQLLGKKLSELGTFRAVDGEPQEPNWREPFRDTRFEVPGDDGRVRAFLLSGLPSYDQKTWQREGFLGTAEHITEREQTENALRESEDRYRHIAECTGDWFFEQDSDGTLTYVSENFELVTGIPCHELIGRKHADLIEWDSMGNRARDIAQLISECRPIRDEEFVIRFPDGKRMWVRGSANPVFSADGAFMGYRGAATDITQHKENEKEKIESENRHREALHIANVGHWEWDLRTYEGRWSEEFARIIGRPKETRLTSIASTVRMVVHPADREKVLKARKDLINGKNPYDVEFRIVRPDGNNRHVHSRAQLVFDDDGVPIRMVGTTHDITERRRAEEVLRESEERHRTLYENTPVMVHSIDQNGRLVSVSNAWLGILGYSREEVIGRESTDFLSEASRRFAKEVVLPDFFRIGICKDIPYQFVKKNAEIVDVELSAISEGDAEGNFLRSLAVLIEVTERKQAEEALRKSKERLRAIVDNTPICLNLKDIEGRYLLINKPYEAWLGYTAEEIIGKKASEFLAHTSEVENLTDAERRVLETGKVFEREVRVPRPDGRFYDRLLIKFPVKSADGSISAIGTAAIDITERKQAEEALRKLSRAVEQSPVTIVVTDTSGIVEYVNPQFESTTGYSAEEAIGQNPRILQSGEMPLEKYEELWAAITSGHEWRGEFHNKRKDGTFYWEQASISPIKSADGTITHFLAVSEEITERKRIESDLLMAKEEAEYANKTKDRFLANMSHELRTPLNAIIGFAEMMHAEAFGPLGTDKYREYTDDILGSGRHILGMLTDVLDITKIESGSLELVEREFDVERTLVPCMRMSQKRADSASVSLSLEVLEHLPHLKADQQRIKQIVLNLLSNAIKFTPEGGRVVVRAETDDEGGIWIQVVDTGVGMAMVDIPKVLEPFEQIGDIITRSHEGSGLGLAIVRSLVDRHGGVLEINSEVGKGTTVTIRFPPERTIRHS
jgi:PAS domain S-box-containing protein